jgi:SAM-dependent methyltransferase
VASRSGAAPHSYAIAGGEDGKRRLDLLSDIMRETTLRLLEDAGLKRGDRVLDVGCGGGHVALDMARIVGSEGHVLGIDFDPHVLDLAREDAREAGVGTVEFETADAHVFDGGPFSFIHARFLLSHVSEPDAVFARLKGMLAPGGRIAIEDIDMSGSYCVPADAAQDRYQTLYTEAVRRGGGDANLARRLPVLALAAGLQARWRVFQLVHATGPEKRLTAVTMEMIRASVLRYGLTDGAEIDRIVRSLNTFADDGSTLVALPRLVQVWGAV